MRAKMTRLSPEMALMRVLDALAQEAIEASDEEITKAAADLRVDLNIGESAAFAGLTYFARPQLSEFFDIAPLIQAPIEHCSDAPPAQPKHRQRRTKRPQTPTVRKPTGGK